MGTCVLYRPRALPYLTRPTDPTDRAVQAVLGLGLDLDLDLVVEAAMSLMGAVAFWLCLNHSKSSGKFNFNVCPPAMPRLPQLQMGRVELWRGTGGGI